MKIKNFKSKCEIKGLGINGFNYKKNITIDAGNSGTLGRLILGLLVHSKYKIKIIGDQSLSKRDFNRIINPLKKFGAKFDSKQGKLPIIVTGTESPMPIKFNENRGSAQCKSSVISFAKYNGYNKNKSKIKKSYRIAFQASQTSKNV